jgi:hypothetical protein
MAGCGSCGARLDIVGNAVGRRDTCPECDAELHACIHCRHYDETVAKQCKEPFAEVPDDKTDANFCEYYQIGDGANRGGPPKKDQLVSAAEALFKKP